MAKPRYPRPGAIQSTTSNRGDEDSRALNYEDVRAAFIAAGMDPETIPTFARNSVKTEADLADLIESEVTRDILADDLSRDESLAFASCFWTGEHRRNGDRAKSVWRIMTFMARYPNCGWGDIPTDLLDSSFFGSFAMPRKSVSSIVHWWMANGSFARAETQLNALPVRRWSEHRRQQLSLFVGWEKATQERTAAKRKARLLKNVKKDSRVRVRKGVKS